MVVRFLSLLTVFFLVLASTPTISYADQIGYDRFQCFRFYKGESKKVRYSGGKNRLRSLARPQEPRFKAIGDGTEKPYIPKGKVRELEEPEMTNQCQTYECYLFAVINYINVYNKHHRGPDAPTMSSEYLVANKFLEHIKEALVRGTEDPKLIHDLEGGFPFEAIHLTRTVGLVPKDSWKPRTPLSRWGMATIYKTLGNKIPKYHKELKMLAEQTQSWKSAKVKEKYKEFVDELSAPIFKYLGEMPKTFTYKGKTYTPKSFEQEFGVPRISIFSNHDRGLYTVPDNLHDNMKEAITEQGGEFKWIPATRENLLETIKGYIFKGLPVIIDLEWAGDGHSMVVTGVEYNENTGEVIRYKSMNSWGETFGNKGYAWYTPGDVWKNVTGSYRFSKDNRH